MTHHTVDLLSLVAGSLILAIGLVLLSGGVSDVPMEWVGPAVAIGLGVVILFAARPQGEPRKDEPAPTDEA